MAAPCMVCPPLNVDEKVNSFAHHTFLSPNDRLCESLQTNRSRSGCMYDTHESAHEKMHHHCNHNHGWPCATIAASATAISPTSAPPPSPPPPATTSGCWPSAVSAPCSSSPSSSWAGTTVTVDDGVWFRSAQNILKNAGHECRVAEGNTTHAHKHDTPRHQLRRPPARA